MIIYRDTFFVKKSGVGLSALGILGLIVWILCLKKVFGKLPKIMYFLMLFFLFLAMNYLSGFLVQIGGSILIGASLSLPLNYVIFAINEDGVTDLREISKAKARKRMKNKKIEVEVE